MIESQVKQALARRGVAFGHMVQGLLTPAQLGILSHMPLDFVLIDMEHSWFDVSQIAPALAYLRTTSLTPLVRVPEAQYHFISRVLDAGALGIMVPNVTSGEHARQVVNAAKYPPEGRRGVGMGIAHTMYAVPDPAAYMKAANETILVICQIESKAGLENLEAIALTPGVDVLWVGHMDLSTSLGIPGQFRDPQFLSALEKVVAVARKYNKVAGIQPDNLAQAREWMELGFNMLSYGTDIALYRRALSAEVSQLLDLWEECYGTEDKT